jgi:GNAT superfamily N-acetyltransferase
VDVHLTTSAPAEATIKEAASVYAAAFAEPPYFENADTAGAFAERVGRYARDRDGFRLVMSYDDAGQMTGVALAVVARPGDWWRDKAAAAIPPSLAEEWLGEKCLEVVHVAVVPSAQGRGIGRVLHDVLIAGMPAPSAVLTVHPAAERAQRLYLGRGWTTLTQSFPAAGAQYWLMGRSL